MFEGSFLYERKFLERFIFTDYFTDEERLILLEILSDFKGDMITESLIESYTEKEFLFEKIGSISPISGTKPIKNIFKIKRFKPSGAIKATNYSKLSKLNVLKKPSRIRYRDIHTIGRKLRGASTTIKWFIKVILEEFDKSFLFFTKASQRDVNVSASWIIKKYPNIKLAAERVKTNEKSYLSDLLGFFNDKLLKKVRNLFKGLVSKSVKESLLFDGESSGLLLEMERFLETYNDYDKPKTSSVVGTINKIRQGVGKDEVRLPKGTIGKIKFFIKNSIKSISDVIDLFYKGRTKLTLYTVGKVVEKLGGPSMPDGGIDNIALIYTYSGIHSQGGFLGGGMMKNWKRSLGLGIRQGVSSTVSLISPALGIVGLGIPYILKLIKISKKIQVTNMIIRIASGEAKVVKTGDTRFFGKNVE